MKVYWREWIKAWDYINKVNNSSIEELELMMSKENYGKEGQGLIFPFFLIAPMM